MIALSNSLDPDTIQIVFNAFDFVCNDYDIQKKETAISIINDIPDEVKYYLVSKTIENLSKETIKQYRHKLENFFKAVHKRIKDVTTTDIRIYLYNYKTMNNNTDSSVENTRRILNAFFQWAEENEYIEHNPVIKVERIKFQQKERKPLSQLSLEEVRCSCKNKREKALIDFLYSTGCRVSECSNVQLSDINWTERSIVIRHGKGNKRRTVFFNAAAELSLRNYIKSRQDQSPYLFVTNRKPYNKLGVKSIQNDIREIGQRCDIVCTPHILRHTFATTGLRAGIPLELLQTLMGHSKPETTLIYAKIDKAALKLEHQKAFG